MSSRSVLLSLCLLSLCLLILGVGGPVVFGQSAAEQPQDEEADVVIDGRAVLRVKGIRSFSPEFRANAIAGRIIRLASDPYFNTASIEVVESDISSDIVASDLVLMSVLDADAAEAGSRQELAVQNARLIQVSINQYRRDHSSRNLLKGSLIAALTTLVFIVILFLIQRFHHKIRLEVPRWTNTQALPALLKKYEIIHADRVSALTLGLLNLVRMVFVLVLLYFYVGLVLSFFPWTRELAGQLRDLVIGPLQTIGLGFRDQVPKLFFIFILALITRYVLKVMRVFFAGVESGAIEMEGFDRDWATPTYKLLRILVLAFAVTIAYPYIPGSGTDAFKGVSIFLGVLLSLGSTSLVSNVISGLTMTYMRAFKVGDRVTIDNFTGDVIATGLQVTHIKTPKNEVISVPNSMVTNRQVTNYSALARTQGLILHTTVGIGYGTPWRQVRAMLLMAAERTTGLLREPSAFVLQKSLGDFCVTYELNAYTNLPHEMGIIYSILHKNILDVFNEYGVQIMTPHYEGDRQIPAVVPKENWEASPADRFSDADDETEKGKPRGASA